MLCSSLGAYHIFNHKVIVILMNVWLGLACGGIRPQRSCTLTEESTNGIGAGVWKVPEEGSCDDQTLECYWEY